MDMTSKLRYSNSPPLEWLLEASYDNGSGHEEESTFYSQAEHVLTGYIFGVLLFIGITGNVVSFVVLQNQHFSQSSMRFLLSALAFVDTGLLFFGLLRQWLWELLDKDPRSINDAVCKIWYFGVYFFGQLSPWTIVLLTSERFLSIYWPMKAKTVLSTRRVVITWAVLASILFLLNAHAFWKVIVLTVQNETICMHSDHWHGFHMEIWLWTDFLLVCALPFILITSLNVATIVRLTRVKNRRSSITSSGSRRNTRDHASTTFMLIVVSLFFLVTTSPLELFFLISDLENTEFNDFIYSVCNFFYYLNSSANFGLYCLSGSVFRLALGATFTRRRHSIIRESQGHQYQRGSWNPTESRRSSRLEMSSYGTKSSNSFRASPIGLIDKPQFKFQELQRIDSE